MEKYITSIGTCINVTTIIIQKIDSNSTTIVEAITNSRGNELDGLTKVIPLVCRVAEGALAEALYSVIVEVTHNADHADEEAEKKTLAQLVTTVQADLLAFITICNDVCAHKKGTDSDASKLQKKVRELEKRFTLFAQ